MTVIKQQFHGPLYSLGKCRAIVINPIPEIDYVIIHYFIELALVPRNVISTTVCIHTWTTTFVDATHVCMTERAFVGNRPVLSAMATVNCGAARLTLLTDYDFVSHRRPFNLSGDTSPVALKSPLRKSLFTAKPAWWRDRVKPGNLEKIILLILIKHDSE